MTETMGASVQTNDGVAVITGAASGIGTGLARKALALGMKLVIADVRAEPLEAFAATLDGEVLAVPTDVRDLTSVEALAEAAYDRFGQVDMLFNNAGVMATGFSWEIEPELWNRAMSVNVDGVQNGIRAFVPRLLAAERPAYIINTASVGGFLPAPLMAPYSVSKAAVVALTESLHYELQMIGAPVRVSLLSPGPVKSGIFDDPFGPNVSPAAAAFVDTMRSMLNANGLTPDEFAELVYEGLAEGRYWLFPQPETIDAPFQHRVTSMMDRVNPQLIDFSEL